MAKWESKNVTLTITEPTLEALWAVFDRSEDDWLYYRNSGHGPKDFIQPGEWREHKRAVDGAHAKARKFLLRLGKLMLDEETETRKGK